MPDQPDSRGVHVALEDISKSFGGVHALEGISLQIARGSIHALVGENGAGKSTLGKIISGAITPDTGRVLLTGQSVHFHSPREAIARGVVLIAQELSVVPALSIAENVFLGAEPQTAGVVRRGALLRQYNELAARYGFALSGSANAGSLRTADQQKLEILRALGRNAELIVMDEPTAALSRPDVRTLHEIIRSLAAAGTTVVLVSHFLSEVLELADEVTVLRDGRVVRSGAATGQTEDTLLAAMLGASIAGAFPSKRYAAPDAQVALSVEGLSAPGVSDVSLEVRTGEIVGLAGLIGAGRSELARAVYRANRASSGSVTVLGGKSLVRRRRLESPRIALDAGVAMIPESRRDQGLLPGRPVRENVSVASLREYSTASLVAGGSERRAVERMLTQLEVRTAGQGAPAITLSGGNQQKLLFARMLLRRPRVLIADEPTRGVDVGAKRAIYEILATLAAEGMAVLLISSDVEELIGLAHRVLVMRAGKVVAGLAGEQINEEAILGAAFGTAEKGVS